jgi:hypothetical protein
MESQSSPSLGSRTEPWLALALCAAVGATEVLQHVVRSRPVQAVTFAPDWLPLAAAVVAAAGILPVTIPAGWRRARRMLHWSGLMLMVWAANGLPLHLLRLTPLMPRGGVDWPVLVTKTLALAAVVVLAHLALARPAVSGPDRPARWCGYAAFVLAMPYPVLRTIWALGGTLGIGWPGAAGQGWVPWLISIPWLLAAVVSLLLIPTWRWMPRRLLLTAGWTGTTIVAMVAPAACWTLLTVLLAGGGVPGPKGISTWIFGLFYGSWFLWAIAAGAATRSYQLRSAPQRT